MSEITQPHGDMPEWPPTRVAPLPQEFQPTEGFTVMERMVAAQLEDFKFALSRFENDPSQDMADSLSEVANTHNNSMRIALTALEAEEEGTVEDRIDDMISFVVHLEAARASYLNQDVEEGEDLEYKPVTRENMAELREHLVRVRKHKDSGGGLDLEEDEEDHCDATSHLMEVYVDSMAHDVGKFIDKKRKAYNALPSTKRKQMLKTMGYHAMDVAKTSAGVVIGGLTLGAIASVWKNRK